MKEFCKIFTVDDQQVLVRKGIIKYDKKQELAIVISVFASDPLKQGVHVFEVPIPCCCLECQHAKFEETNQKIIETIYKQVIQKQMKMSDFIYPNDFHKN